MRRFFQPRTAQNHKRLDKFKTKSYRDGVLCEEPLAGTHPVVVLAIYGVAFGAPFFFHKTALAGR